MGEELVETIEDDGLNENIRPRPLSDVQIVEHGLRNIDPASGVDTVADKLFSVASSALHV